MNQTGGGLNCTFLSLSTTIIEKNTCECKKRDLMRYPRINRTNRTQKSILVSTHETKLTFPQYVFSAMAVIERKIACTRKSKETVAFEVHFAQRK